MELSNQANSQEVDAQKVINYLLNRIVELEMKMAVAAAGGGGGNESVQEET